MATVTQLNVEIGAKLDKLDKGLGQANRKIDKFGNQVGGVDKKLSGFNKNIAAVGKGLIGAFAGVEITRAIGGFISDAGRMAAEAEGVSNAFDKLNKPGILSQLQVATRGTVNNLELMRKAVQANNFKIPLERLGTFFKFATNRAIETGESVDFLVNSIVTGIGRKSPLILDNLGISAAELSAEIKKVGDFGIAAGNIIEREMVKAGEVLDTAAVASQRLSTSIDNLKLTFGSFVTSPGAVGFTNFLSDAIDGLSSAFGIIFSSSSQGTTALSLRIKKIRNEIQGLDRLLESDRSFGVLSNIGISSTRTEEETNALIEKRKGLINELLSLAKFENQGAKDKNNLLDIALDKTDLLKEKADEAAKAQQSQFKELQNIISGGTGTLSPVGNFKILQGGDSLSVLNKGISDEFFKSVEDGNAKVVDSLNQSIGRTQDFNGEIQDLAISSNNFTNVLSSGLTSIIGLLFKGSSEADKFGSIITRIVGGIFGTVLGGPLGGAVSSIFGSFASGGIALGPQLAVIGDNPGKREAIIPSELFGKIGGDNQGGTQEFRIKGQDLVTVLKRQAKLDNRTR